MGPHIKKSLNLAQILEKLEKPLSSDDDDDEVMDNRLISSRSSEVIVNILPPDNNDAETDEDSGDEEEVHLSNLPGSQILAEASSNVTGFVNNEPDNIRMIPTKRKRSRHWIEKDLNKNSLGSSTYPFKPSSATLPRKAYQIFELFLDEDAITLLTRQTVNFAAQKGHHGFSLSNDEMRVFIGILLLSGYCSVSRRRMYWESEIDASNQLIINSMRRNRFEEIMRFFHAADNNELDQQDKFAKVRPLLNILSTNFLVYGSSISSSDVSIDESMVPYYGRHPTKQFIRGKPIRWGYKAWVAANPIGYVFALDMYQGKYGTENDKDYRKLFGLGGAVVLNFIDRMERGYPGRKFNIYFDNFFTSLKLLDEITERGHGSTGTIRSNRVEKCPLSNSKQFQKLPRGSEEHLLDNENNILIVRWNDNATVCIASNQHGVLPIKKAERYSAAAKKKVTVTVPCVIHEYNRNMGGVDRMDENIARYRIAIRGKKWYFPIICYLINVSVNNAWLFAREGGCKQDLLAFTREIVNSWLKKYGKLPVKPGPKSVHNSLITEDRRFDGLHHNIETHPEKRRLRCRQCSSTTVHRCTKCDVPMHLKCATAYHESKQL